VDENKKKIWEILVCESPLDILRQPESLFRFSQFCPGSQVNSVTLQNALHEAIAQAPQPPEKIRFFRRQMTKMITKACNEIGIPVQASRRTFALNQWIQQRNQEVYPQHPGFAPLTNPSVQFEAVIPQPLPDALIGQQWAFVTLEANAFQEMPEWTIDFNEAFPLQLIGLSPETQVPGLVIFSPRAKALAAWMSGLELVFLKFERQPSPQLLLETGASDRWILAKLPNAQTQAEAESFETTKQKAQQVHFLAIQSDPQAEAFAGFWLLQEVNLS
jgi:hypothetical protein